MSISLFFKNLVQCMCVCVQVCTHTCSGHRRTLLVFLYHSLPYFCDKVLSSRAPGIGLCPFIPQCQGYRRIRWHALSFHVRMGICNQMSSVLCFHSDYSYPRCHRASLSTTFCFFEIKSYIIPRWDGRKVWWLRVRGGLSVSWELLRRQQRVNAGKMTGVVESRKVSAHRC